MPSSYGGRGNSAGASLLGSTRSRSKTSSRAWPAPRPSPCLVCRTLHPGGGTRPVTRSMPYGRWLWTQRRAVMPIAGLVAGKAADPEGGRGEAQDARRPDAVAEFAAPQFRGGDVDGGLAQRDDEPLAFPDADGRADASRGPPGGCRCRRPAPRGRAGRGRRRSTTRRRPRTGRGRRRGGPQAAAHLAISIPCTPGRPGCGSSRRRRRPRAPAGRCRRRGRPARPRRPARGRGGSRVSRPAAGATRRRGPRRSAPTSTCVMPICRAACEA